MGFVVKSGYPMGFPSGIDILAWCSHGVRMGYMNGVPIVHGIYMYCHVYILSWDSHEIQILSRCLHKIPMGYIDCHGTHKTICNSQSVKFQLNM